MATDVERLIVTLEASTKKYENALNRAKSQTDRQSAAIDKRFKQLSQQIDANMDRSAKSLQKGFDTSGIAKSFSGLAGRIAGIGGPIGVVAAAVTVFTGAAAKLGDTWNAVGNRLKSAGIATRDLGSEQDRVSAIALKTHSDLSATTDLYVKMIGVTKSLGVSNGQAADATQAVAQSLSLAGVSAEAASGTITQLGQALGSGVLRGDEFNSIMESLGTQSPLIQSIAREFGVTANQLRDLAAAGKLTTDRVFRAIVAAKPEIEDLADGAVPTLSQAWTDLDTATTRWVATMGGGSKIANSVGAAMEELAKKIDGVTNAYDDYLQRRDRDADETTLKAPQMQRDLIAQVEKEIADQQANDPTSNLLLGLRATLVQLKEQLKVYEQQADVKKEELATVQKISEVQAEMLRETARARALTAQTASDPVQDALDKRTQAAGASDKDKEIAKATDDIIEAMKKAGTKLDGVALYDAAKAQAEREYQINVGAQATEAIVKAYVDRVVKAESGGDPTAKNPNSTATGAGQFIEKTWLDLFRKYYPEQAQTMGRDAILALRNDSNISRNLIEKYAEENASVLQKAGVSVNEAALQLSHFLGAGDAAKVLKAASGTPLQGLISQRSINANPRILGGGKTVDDAIAYANTRANDTRIAAGDLSANERRAQSIQEIIAANQQEIASMKASDAAKSQSAYQADYLATREKLLADAKRAGIALTPEVVASLENEARQHATAAAQVAVHQKQYEALRQVEQAFGDLALDAFEGLIDGSKDFKGALEDLLKSLAKMVLQAALLGQGPLASLFGGGGTSAGGMGGIFGAVLSFFGAKDGGYLGGFANGGGLLTGPGTGRSDSILASNGKGKFARFSNGEFMTNAASTKKWRWLLELINDDRLSSTKVGGQGGRIPLSDLLQSFQVPGYADGGGLVGMAANVNPSRLAASSQGATAIHMPITIDARGATRDAIPQLQAELIKLRRDVPGLVMNAKKRGVL
jgi:tape measure domain-containing protein